MGYLRGTSLRFRLGLLYAGLLLLSVAILGCCSYWQIWYLFLESKASHLRARAKPVIEHWLEDTEQVDKTGPEVFHNFRYPLVLARDLTSKDASALVLDSKGHVLASGRRLPEEPLSPEPDDEKVAEALSGNNEVTFLKSVNDRCVLVVLIPLRPAPGSPEILGVVQMSAPLNDIRQILFRHGTMLVSLAALIIIAGTLAGFFFISWSLADLGILVKACNEIRKGNFPGKVRVGHFKDEIGILAVAFNDMMDRLQATFESQKRFVANAAHELLTPLTGLKGSLEVLLRGAQDDPSAVARLSRGMYQEVNRLIRVCEQLLSLSRLQGSISVRCRPIEIGEFFKEFEWEAKVLAQGRDVIFRKGPLARAKADPDLLKQIMLNLLSNALRYSSVDEPVTITWELLSDSVKIIVADRGQGIDSNTLSRIFEPFYQGENQSSATGRGAGLGLSLVKSMVNAMGGSVFVKSSPGKGTSVSFTLPLAT